MTGARDKLLRHVHGSCVNIKREIVLSPNDEEVANSSKKTRVHKPYPERVLRLAPQNPSQLHDGGDDINFTLRHDRKLIALRVKARGDGPLVL